MRCLVFLCALSCIAPVFAAEGEAETSREIELRVRATDATRLHALLSLTRHDLRQFREGALGIAVHHAVSARWAWRIGARGLSSSEDAGEARGELRGIGDVYWMRSFGPEGRWTLANRSRLDLRSFSDAAFSWRLRDRLTLERAFATGLVPYASYELFHDARHDRISRGRAAVGLTVPLGQQASIDLYAQHSRSWFPAVEDTATVGASLVVTLAPGR